jgi:hypothetical protein
VAVQRASGALSPTASASSPVLNTKYCHVYTVKHITHIVCLVISIAVQRALAVPTDIQPTNEQRLIA